MVQELTKTLLLEEFLKLPETKPAREYIDGQIIEKPMPQGKHSVIQGELVSLINQIVKKKHIARAFPELRCTFGNRSIVPDVSVYTWDRIPRDTKGEIANYFELAPDWTIEILSPSQNQTKVTKNILHCLKHGSTMGWLVDPNEQTVFVYQPQKEIQYFDDPEAQIEAPLFASDLELTIGSLFAWLNMDF